jgi:hypothetical protein
MDSPRVTRSTKNKALNTIHDLPPLRGEPSDSKRPRYVGPSLPKKELKEQRLNQLQRKAQETAEDDDELTLTFVRKINQLGYFVVDGEPPNPNHIRDIDYIKSNMRRDIPIFENVLEKVIRKRYRNFKDVRAQSIFKDRLLDVIGQVKVDPVGQCDEIDDCFKANFQKVVQLLKSVVVLSSFEQIWDLSSVNYARILSTDESTMQQVHFDYEGDWAKFDEVERTYGFTPLSVLHCPEGGFLTIYPCDSQTGRQYRAEQAKMVENNNLHPNTLRCQAKESTMYFGGKKIVYRNISVTPFILEIEPNQTVIFRGKICQFHYLTKFFLIIS